MKFNKTVFIASLLASGIGFTACDNDDDYVPGASAGEYNIGFDTEADVALGLQDMEITVDVTRDNTEGELVVPIQPVTVPGCMTVPQSVTFADGSATATLTITVGEDMKLFTTYPLCVRIPNRYNTFYEEDSKCPTLNLSIQKDDYKVVANGNYVPVVFSDEEWEQPVEYSPLKGIYRLPDCISPGTHWYFAFDGSEEFSFTDENGNPTSKMSCGFTFSTYGTVSAEVIDGVFCGYDAGKDRFCFPFAYKVSAGTLDEAYEFLYITEWIEKPWETQAAE